MFPTLNNTTVGCDSTGGNESHSVNQRSTAEIYTQRNRVFKEREIYGDSSTTGGLRHGVSVDCNV